MTLAEQEHIKQIYLYTCGRSEKINTKELASMVNTKPGSVTDMIKKLAVKGLINYNKYHGCSLSEKGLG